MEENYHKEENQNLEYEINRIKVKENLLHFSTLHRVKKLRTQIL